MHHHGSKRADVLLLCSGSNNHRSQGGRTPLPLRRFAGFVSQSATSVVPESLLSIRLPFRHRICSWPTPDPAAAPPLSRPELLLFANEVNQRHRLPLGQSRIVARQPLRGPSLSLLFVIIRQPRVTSQQPRNDLNSPDLVFGSPGYARTAPKPIRTAPKHSEGVRAVPEGARISPKRLRQQPDSPER